MSIDNCNDKIFTKHMQHYMIYRQRKTTIMLLCGKLLWS